MALLPRKRRTALLVALAVASPAVAGGRDEARVLMPTDARQAAEQDRLGYATAVVSGGTVYVSGVIAWLKPGDTDMAASYERAFAQIGAALKQAGSSFDDIVDITSFHTDPNAQIEAMAAVKKRHVRAPHPAWTAVGTSGLLGKGGITEIKVVAALPAAATN